MARAGYLLDPTGGFEALILLDEESGDSVEFQRPLSAARRGSVARPDEYCVVRAGGPAFYGGIDSWRISEATLVVQFSEEASGVLEFPPEVHIPIEPETLTLVEDHLPTILGDAQP